jgi:hypothetical protein
MNIKAESRTSLVVDPFQVKFPDEFELCGESPDGYATFGMELTGGVMGIQGEMPLYVSSGAGVWESSDDPEWWACFGFGLVPGPANYESHLRLFYLHPTFFDCSHKVVATWDSSDSTFQEHRDLLMGFFDPSEKELTEAADLIKRLLAEKFSLREIIDPATQIPGYKPEHHSVIFGE